jgi:hypothetical protein
MAFSKMIVCLAAIALGACSQEDKKITVSTKLRSTGVKSIGLVQGLEATNGTKLVNVTRSSTAFQYTSIKVPIFNIVLAEAEIAGARSPNFYQCAGATPDDCMVELLDSSVDSLIEDSSIGSKIEPGEERTYHRVVISNCPSTAGTFNIKITGSVTLNGSTYYTSASGLTTTGPATAASIPAKCAISGVTTTLAVPITLKPGGDPIDIVLYANPSAIAVATTTKTLLNSSCLGEETLAICSGMPAVFATVDTEKPKAEFYKLEPTEMFDGSPYGSILLTLLFTSSDFPFGAVMQQLYADKSEARALPMTQLIFSQVTSSSAGTVDLNYGAGTISSLARKVSSSVKLPKTEFTGAPVWTYTSTPL